MTVESVTAGLLYLVGEEAPARLVLCAGAGGYAATRIYETQGICLLAEEQTPENIALNIEHILNPSMQTMLQQGGDQTMRFINRAVELQGLVR